VRDALVGENINDRGGQADGGPVWVGRGEKLLIGVVVFCFLLFWVECEGMVSF
jgi:hypothetical protein